MGFIRDKYNKNTFDIYEAYLIITDCFLIYFLVSSIIMF